jgi:hypothetical protein
MSCRKLRAEAVAAADEKYAAYLEAVEREERHKK